MAKGQRYLPRLPHFSPLPFAFSLGPFNFSLLTFPFSFRPGRGARGFTLLEILVALAVLAIVVVGFLRGNAVMIANADHLRDKTLAHWVAMNRGAELRLAGQWLGEEGAQGVAVLADRRWRWRATGKASPDPEMQIVTIEVRPGEGEAGSPLAGLTIFLGQASGAAAP